MWFYHFILDLPKNVRCRWKQNRVLVGLPIEAVRGSLWQCGGAWCVANMFRNHGKSIIFNSVLLLVMLWSQIFVHILKKEKRTIGDVFYFRFRNRRCPDGTMHFECVQYHIHRPFLMWGNQVISLWQGNVSPSCESVVLWCCFFRGRRGGERDGLGGMGGGGRALIKRSQKIKRTPNCPNKSLVPLHAH